MRPRVTLQLPSRPLASARAPGSGDRFLMIGEGYVAQALRPHLELGGASVTATTRETLDSQHTRAAFARATHVVVSVPPARAGSEPGHDPALRVLAGQTTQARWIGYLSATSVYGDRAGGWCFEGEAPTPGLPRGRRRAEAEIAWIEAYPQTQIFRLAGIYGPEIGGVSRSPFDRLRDGTARVIEAPGHVVNRVHVEDIVDALLRSVARPSPGDVFNIADGQPAPPGEVLDHAADLLGVARPPRVALDDPAVSAMARSFYAESKRVDIARARARLGWQPRFADYKAGLAALLAG